MKKLLLNDPDYAAQRAAFNRRAAPAPELKEAVEHILKAVAERGDEALAEFSRKFDHCSLSLEKLRVTDAEITAACERVPSDVREALGASHRNVRAFAEQGKRRDWSRVNEQGGSVGERFLPFQRVGLYVPGGTAPLVSTVLMTVTLAQVAGCEEIVVCTPPSPEGRVNDALLFALRLAGATEIWKLGGAHAVGAMAYGTEMIRPVSKIYGPGNKYVVEAKRQCVGLVAIDLLPGPSEVMVLADDTARADFVAADLLAQAEHGGESAAVLVTDSRDFLTRVESEIERQSVDLPRREHLLASLAACGWLIEVDGLEDGVRLVNQYAPEHLGLVTRRDDELIPQIRTAGAIFVGPWSPVAVGDFLAGPSHTLPTGGAGKSFAGLTVEQFQLRSSIVRLDEASVRSSAPLVEKIAEVEGLRAHARSAIIR